MRIARIKTSEGPQHAVGRNGSWDHIVDPFAESLIYTGGSTPGAEAVFLAPVRPSVVLGIAHNRTLNNHPHDVTNVDQGAVDERNFQGKAGTNYTPLGPWIETDIPDPDFVGIDVWVNGVAKATSGSFNLPSSVIDCLVYVTSWLSLEPGDVVMTGAPGTAVAVQPGDSVDIVLGGIGTLTNRIV